MWVEHKTEIDFSLLLQIRDGKVLSFNKRVGAFKDYIEEVATYTLLGGKQILPFI